MGLNKTLIRSHGGSQATAHWWMTRLTSIALIPLTFYFVFSLIRVAGADYEVMALWIAWPFNTVMLVLFLAVSFYHAAQGLQEVIEDYVHNKTYKMVALLVMKAMLALWGAAAVIAVIRVACAGGAHHG